MRLLIRYFFIWLFILCMPRAEAQQENEFPLISENYQGLTLSDLLSQLSQKTGYTFYFNVSDLGQNIVQLSFNNERLPDVLKKAFAGTSLVFSADTHHHIFIHPKFSINTELAVRIFDEDSSGKQGSILLTGEDPLLGIDTVAKKQNTLTENKLYLIGDKSKKGSLTGKATLAGYLKDASTGEAVVGASLQLDKTKTQVISDEYGYFSISVPKGRNNLIIHSLGMMDTHRQLMVYGDGILNIDLQTQIITLRNVTVSADKTSLIRGMQMGVQKVDIKTIKQVPVAFGEADILRVVLTMPGVKSVGEASTGLNVRGGAADQNLILLNDATIFNPSHFFGLFSAFNPEVVKDVQLYKSVIPAKYGGRLSSVLEVNSREGNKKNFTGSAGIGLLTSRVTIEGPLVKDKTSFILGVRTTYANWLLKLLPDQYKNSKAGFGDINLVLSHEINKKNNLYFTGYFSNDNFNLNNDTTYGYSNQNLSLKWKHVFNNKWTSTVTGGQDRYNYGIKSELNPVNAYQLSFDINQLYVKTHINFYASNQHSIEFGFNTQLDKLHPGDFIPKGSASLVVPDHVNQEQALESAFYLSDKYTISPSLSVEGAVRYSHYMYLGAQTINQYAPGIPKTETNQIGSTSYGNNQVIQTYQGPEIRAAIRYAFNENFSVKAGYNTLRQYFHALSNTTAIAPTDIWKLSDPNIKPQFGSQYSLGFYHNFASNTIETSLEVYYKKISDYLDYKSGATLVLNHHIETDVLPTRGKAYGIELLLKKSTGKFNGWLSYTYSRTLLQMNDSTAGTPINKGAYYPANYDKPHDITFVGNYRATHRFSVSVNLTYSTGRPITLPIGRFFYGNSQRTLYSDRNEYRIPDNFRTDISLNLDGNHKINQLTHNSFTVGVYNLTGRKNPYSVYYVSENGVINGYKLSIFGNAIPYINYTIRF